MYTSIEKHKTKNYLGKIINLINDFLNKLWFLNVINVNSLNTKVLYPFRIQLINMIL